MIIGICGAKGAGKSTLAAAIEREFNASRVSFAEPMRRMMSALMEYGGEVHPHQWFRACLKESPCDALNGHSVRHAMQTLGTEWGRAHMGDDFWVEIARRRIANITGHVVIDDVRFANEAALCDVLIEVVRQGTGGTDSHVSEAGGLEWHAQFHNTGSRAAVDQWARHVVSLWVR